MNTLYWTLEYIKVLAIYIALMFVWPSVVFRKYLNGKSKTFHFSFCVTFQVLFINTVVLCLGLLHILNRWTMVTVFYGILILSLLYGKKFSGNALQEFHHLLNGTKGMKLFILQILHSVRRNLRLLWKRFVDYTKGHRVEYLTLLILVVFGMLYFSYGTYKDNSYGFGDMYTHHSWIYGLIQGKIFSAGIYPEAMHCFIYSMYALFGVRVYSALLFLAGIHVSVLLVSVYCFLKEVLRSRYAGIFAIALFLTLDVLCIDEVYSMSRLQWTLPQEFGFYTMFLCAMYLVRYLRAERVTVKENGKRKLIVWDENLLIFVLALAASLAIHFYVTIMAFFLCLAFAVFAIHRIFRKGNFRSLIAGVIIGVMIAVIPMGLAYASGIQFQGSIGWAVNVMNGTDEEQFGPQVSTEETQLPTEIPDNTTSTISSTQGTTDAGSAMSQPTPSMKQKIERLIKRIPEIAKDKMHALYDGGYATLYQEERANWILLFTAIAAGLGLVCCFVTIVIKRKLPIEGYWGITLASIIFMIMYASTALGLPSLIARSRLCSVEQILILSVMVVPFDLVFYLLEQTKIRKILPLVSLLGVGGIYWATHYFGVFHSFLYNELTRYNSAVYVTNEILEQLPDNSYTVVSPTDETYQVIQNGRHEEILNFLRKIQQGTYSLPTKYVAFYVEKRPIKYAQSHFQTGPEWLAEEKYFDFYSKEFSSEGDDLIQSKISKAMANRELMQFAKEWDTYSDMDSRTIMESKMYYWCEAFMKEFPNEMEKGYEDDDFVCYILKQNTNRLFNLEEEW